MRVAVGIGLLVATSLGLAFMVSTETCESADGAIWQSPVQIERQLRAAGMRPLILRPDRGQCLSALVQDERGELRALIVNPTDGSIVRTIELR